MAKPDPSSSNPPLPLDCAIDAALALTLLWGPEPTSHRSHTPEKDYTVRGILQAGILEWVAIPFSRGSSQPRDRAQVSVIAVGSFIN